MTTGKTSDYHYPRQRINGVWLIIVGIAMLTLTMKLINGFPNPDIFVILYSLGMFWQLNKHTRQKLSVGPGTKAQSHWANGAIIIMMALMLLVFLPSWLQGGVVTYAMMRRIWLEIMIVIGIHFFFFIPVHGKLMGILGGLTIINSLLGLLLGWPLDLVFVIDGLLKLIFGLIFVKVSPINF